MVLTMALLTHYKIQASLSANNNYILDLLLESGRTACKPASAVSDPYFKHGDGEAQLIWYSTLTIGWQLLCLNLTRPDTAHFVEF